MFIKKNFYKKKFVIKKYFSQVFLKDISVINELIKKINFSDKQLIIEIGPGFGALTTELIKHVTKMIAIEIDSDLVYFLRSKFSKSKIDIIHQDVMKVNFTKISNQYKKKLRLLGNLPYNISVPLILYFFDNISFIYDMYFMLQKEVAERLLANPNSKAYGRLSVISQYHCKVIPIAEILPQSFSPIPKVSSIMIKLIPHHHKIFDSCYFETLSYITKIAFSKRRKIISNSLKDIFTIKQLESIGICSLLRAENISVQNYCKLTDMLVNTRIKNNLNN